MHLLDIFTSCKLHQKLRSLDFLPTEVVTKMRQQQRRVRCLNTKDQCNSAQMAGEWNAPTRGTITKQIGLLLTYFQLITMIRNCQMFHSILGLKINRSFSGVFELKHQHLGIALLRFAAISIRWNRVVSLDKSILYLQFICRNVQFYIRTSCS